MPSIRRSPLAAMATLCAAAAAALLLVAAPTTAANSAAAAAPMKTTPMNKAAAASPAAASPAAAAVAAPSAAKKKSSPPPIPPLPTPTPYVICEDQTYALCAASSAFVFQNVAYAKCVIKNGDSISAPPLSYRVIGSSPPEIDNICDMNAQGVDNGYMMSTFSLPESIKKGGPEAIYTCPGGSQGGYGQCDGGTCFKSTISQTFPGVGDLGADEIICSCPIVMATTASAPFGWQFIAEYPCNPEAFAVCDQDPRTGDIIPVGAPPGAGRLLTELLYGQQYELNECFSPDQ
jgi:hypothetical protein